MENETKKQCRFEENGMCAIKENTRCEDDVRRKQYIIENLEQKFNWECPLFEPEEK